ncbi:MAG: site-2 protease family protein [Candidatus Magasanikbacteria bacterium CG11_big_fil_rev_8_21_14_0_20_43_7]|uniref:Site-2 protease family protein n=1 Tax=Candidatus Magasanikbacteria bacterium CG11_big_fil_rev_8_21_14_0_20_43_7 TaxID=1974654 RepID=A0A2H0N4I1_9BACT|nr:MAG: site-2 protease family protein [Candidatus Magasanikbacteria bacterium CG11_big_fil_rev_8_21_14_0_20_43_7]
MSTIFFIFVIVFSAIIHEYSHGWMAERLGDPTAKYAGRLTLNPLKHIDPIGSILLPLLLIPTGFLFAYAKPVPYNPYNLKDQKWGPVKVALAGPISNFILAFLFGLTVQFLPMGSMTEFLYIIVYANVILGVFNLVPIPPLDGSKVLFAVLPENAVQIKHILEQYGFLILIVFIFTFSSVLTPIIQFFVNVFTGGGIGF